MNQQAIALPALMLGQQAASPVIPPDEIVAALRSFENSTGTSPTTCRRRS